MEVWGAEDHLASLNVAWAALNEACIAGLLVCMVATCSRASCCVSVCSFLVFLTDMHQCRFMVFADRVGAQDRL